MIAVCINCGYEDCQCCPECGGYFECSSDCELATEAEKGTHYIVDDEDYHCEHGHRDGCSECYYGEFGTDHE